MHTDADLYAVLGLPSSASAEDIRTAYYRQVRRHPPEKDAEGFQRVQRAYDVLSNPETRREYDDQRRTDPETQRLVEEGRRLLEQDDDGALVHLKRALVRHPDSLVIRDLLVQALELAEDYDTAEKHARLLIERAPSVATYQTRLGDVLRLADRDEEAEEPYRRALGLDQETHQPVLNLAYLLNYLERHDEAVDLLERSILRDGRVDFEDFLFFQALCRVYVLNGKLDELARTRERIREILPPDQETRSYVAWFYYKDALMLADRGEYTAALLMIEEAAQIDDSLPELKATAAKMRGSKAALDEINALRDDKSLLPELRFAVGPLVIIRLIGLGGDFRKTFNNASDALANHILADGSPLGAHIRILRQKYPAATKVVDDFLQKLEEDIATSDKPLIALTCPGCGQQAFAPGPSVETLVLGGMNYLQAYLALREGPHAARRHLKFVCKNCGTEFNGLSNGTGAQATASGTSGEATVKAGGQLSGMGVFVGLLFGLIGLIVYAVMIDSCLQVPREPAQRTSTAITRPTVPPPTPTAVRRVPPRLRPGTELYVNSASLNLRNGPGTEFDRIGQIGRFSTVHLVHDTGTGWGRVRLPGGSEGFLSLSYLAVGDGRAARQVWCRENAGSRPTSGKILSQAERGRHTLTVTNGPRSDVLVRLKTGDNTVLEFYIRAGETGRVTTVPYGTYRALVASGRSYSRACGYFMSGLEVVELEESIHFGNYAKPDLVTTLTYSLDGKYFATKHTTLNEFFD